MPQKQEEKILLLFYVTYILISNISCGISKHMLLFILSVYYMQLQFLLLQHTTYSKLKKQQQHLTIIY